MKGPHCAWKSATARSLYIYMPLRQKSQGQRTALKLTGRWQLWYCYQAAASGEVSPPAVGETSNWMGEVPDSERERMLERDG